MNNNMLDNKNAAKDRLEIEEELAVFAKESSMPNDKFMASLQKEYISALQGHNKPKFSFISFMKQNTKVFLAVFAGILVLGGGVGYYFLGYLPNHSISLVTDSEKNRILANIASKNSIQNQNSNSYSLANNARQKNSNLLAGTATDAMYNGAELAPTVSTQPAIGLLMPAKPIDTNYFYSKTETTAGPEYANCPVNYISLVDKKDTSSKRVSEFFSYNSNDGTYKSKSAEYDKNNTLVSFNLSTNEYSIYYLGGSYAVKNVYYANGLTKMIDSVQSGEGSTGTEVAPSEAPNFTTPQSDPDIAAKNDIDIKQFFGEDANVEGVQTINGKEYYVVSWSYQGNCNPDAYNISVSSKMVAGNSVSSSEVNYNQDKFYNKSWFAKDTYDIWKTEVYHNSISGGNLISTNLQTYEAKNLTTSEVNSIFKFDAGVELKEVNDPIIPSQSVLLEEYLNQHSIATLWPANKSLSWIGAKVDYTKYQAFDPNSDRNFYPAGSLGDAEYKYYTDALAESQRYMDQSTYVEPEMTMNFSDASYIDISIYKSEVTDSQILQYTNGNQSDIAPQDIVLTIGGKQVAAKYYAVKTDSFRVEGSNGIVPPDNSNMKPDTSTNFYTIFTYEGHKYSIYTGSLVPEVVGNLEVLHSSVESEKKSILDRAAKAIQNEVPVPVTDPAILPVSRK